MNDWRENAAPELRKYFPPGHQAPVEYTELTIYDVLRRCVESSRWVDQEEKNRALQLVNDLESVSALGTQAGQIKTEGGFQK